MMDVEIPCGCPPRADGSPRHVSDRVTLRDRLDFHAARTIRNAMVLAQGEEDASVAETMTVLSEQYLVFGIESWSLEDAKGKPVPVNRASIAAFLEADMSAMTVADAADSLYSEKVILPLLAMASNSSPPTPTNGSTSAPKGSPRKPPTPSSRSSTTTTRTDGIETTTTALAGASSS